MALTVDVAARHVPQRGGVRMGCVLLTFDDSYPAGGYALSASELGLNELENLIVPNLPGFVTVWDPVAGKILVYESGTADGALTELNDTSALLDGIVARCCYIGS